MNNDPTRIPDPGDDKTLDLARQRLRSLQDGSADLLPYEEWAEDALRDPEVRYQDNMYKALVAEVCDRFQVVFLDSRMTVDEFAKQAQVSPSTIRFLLQQVDSIPKRETMDKIALAFGKPCGYFFNGNAE